MKILGIDTSGKNASVAICDENTVISSSKFTTNLTHSQVILPLVENVLENAKLTIDDIDGFTVAVGPGSYTGLRIGISAVKAMCFAQNKKCIGISTLEALAYNCVCFKGTIVALMHARPNIAYYGIYKSDGITLTQINDDSISDLDKINDIISEIEDDIIVTGDCAKIFSDKYNVKIAPVSNRYTDSVSLCMLAMNKDLIEPDELNAEYLQITKAEKDKQ